MPSIPNPAQATNLPRAASAKPVVTALAVYAASRQYFDVIVRGPVHVNEIKSAIFDELCLEQHGWDYRTSRLTNQRKIGHGQIYCTLTRGMSALAGEAV